MSSVQKHFRSFVGLSLLLFIAIIIFSTLWGWSYYRAYNLGPPPANTYNDKNCNVGGAGSLLIRFSQATFKSYNSHRNYITYVQNGKLLSDGWCKTPIVRDANGRAITLKDLKPGAQIEVTSNAGGFGIGEIQIK